MKKSNISNNIFIFKTNFNLFFNRVKFENINDIEITKENIDFLNNEFNKLELKVAISLASKIIEQLKTLKCSEKFIFEKADLIVSMFSIIEDIKKLSISKKGLLNENKNSFHLNGLL